MSNKNLPMYSEYAYRKPPKDNEFHFIINQVKYIEEFMAKGELAYDNDESATIELLARYYRNYKSLPKNECEELIYQYLNDYYIKTFGQEILNNCGKVVDAISNACSYRRYNTCHGYKPLRDFDGIWITQKEINTIKQLENIEEQELLFGVLCFTKMYDENNRRNMRKVNHLWYVENSVLRRCIGWKKGTVNKVEAMLADFYDRGLVSLIENRDKYELFIPNRQPIFSNQCCIVDDEGEGVVYLDNFDTLGLVWKKILGQKNIKQCVCGRYFETCSNRQKYCPKCGGNKPKKPISRLGKRPLRKHKKQ